MENVVKLKEITTTTKNPYILKLIIYNAFPSKAWFFLSFFSRKQCESYDLASAMLSKFKIFWCSIIWADRCPH